MNSSELWQNLPETEKKNYLEFHTNSYREDLRHSEKNQIEFPRWSIISGYYAMHDITKLFFAKLFNIRITSPNIHQKTIRAIEELIKDPELKNEILKYLNEAKDTFYNIERLKEKVLPLLLKRGKEERVTSQYYTEDYSKKTNINSKKATYFFGNIVNPYIKIIEGLMR